MTTGTAGGSSVPISVQDALLLILEAHEYPQLRALERRVHWIKDLPAEIAEVIQRAEMNPVHEHLNALLWTKARDRKG